MLRTALVFTLLVVFAAQVSAGPVAVFTQVKEVNGSGSDELHLTGLGNLSVLTTGSSNVNPVITVPGDQTSGAQPVVGFWPVLGFDSRAQYEAMRGTVLNIPLTPVTLYAEVWNGAYGATRDVRQVLIDATISGTFGADFGQNSLDWRFLSPPMRIDFGPTVVTLSYVPVDMPDGVPQIQFSDGSPSIGFPGTPYYPTLLEAHVDVERTTLAGDPLPVDPPPGDGSSGGPGGAPLNTPEPTSALLLLGLTAGFLPRMRAMWKP